MTNSHNRTNSHQAANTSAASSSAGSASSTSVGNASGRFFANNNNSGKHAKNNNSSSGSAKKQQQHQLNASLNSSAQSNASRTFYASNQPPQAKGSPTGQKYFSSDANNVNDKFFVPLRTAAAATSTPGKSRSSPPHRGSPTASNGANAASAAVLAQLSSSPPNLSHFAGSKCYDAPAPTALPKPPSHWTTSDGAPVAAAPAKAPTTAVPKQKSQTYFQKGHGKAGAKMGQAAGRKGASHRPGLVHHNPVMSCSREFLMAATQKAGGQFAPVNRGLMVAGGGSSGDYDKFSENLKMILNVRA